MFPETQAVYDFNKAIEDGQFPQTEDAVKKMQPLALMKVIASLTQRFPGFKPTKELKLIACRTPAAALEFVKNITKGPDSDLENMIARGANQSYLYAKDVLKKRFDLGEAVIVKQPEIAVRYAIDVVKGRFFKAENMLRQAPYTKATSIAIKTWYDYYVYALQADGLVSSKEFESTLTPEQQNIVDELKQTAYILRDPKVPSQDKANVWRRHNSLLQYARETMRIPESFLVDFGITNRF